MTEPGVDGAIGEAAVTKPGEAEALGVKSNGAELLLGGLVQLFSLPLNWLLGAGGGGDLTDPGFMVRT